MKIAELGLLPALERLLPHFIVAGKVAARIQEDIKKNGNRNGDAKQGDRFTEVLTDADIIIETYLGSQILATFDDAAFYGEEYERDRVSAYFPPKAPYLITLDPIDGTLYFRDGLPLYSIILTICVDLRIVASVAYAPPEGRFYLATDDDGAFTTTDADVLAGRPPTPFAIKERGNVVLVGKDWFGRKEALERAGFEVANPSQDYDGSKDWYKTSLRMLTGEVAGLAYPAAQLIDAGAFIYIVSKAGGRHNDPVYDPKSMRAKDVICGVSPETYARIAAAIGA